MERRGVDGPGGGDGEPSFSMEGAAPSEAAEGNSGGRPVGEPVPTFPF